MKTEFKKGDLIVVANANYLDFAIFKRFGKNGNPHFIYFSRNPVWLQKTLQSGHIPTHYINRIDSVDSRSIAKVDLASCDDELRSTYENLIDLLKQIPKWNNEI